MENGRPNPSDHPEDEDEDEDEDADGRYGPKASLILAAVVRPQFSTRKWFFKSIRTQFCMRK